MNKAQGLGRRAQGQKKLCASESSVRDNKVIFTAESAEKRLNGISHGRTRMHTDG